jgi:hypothetical protein
LSAFGGTPLRDKKKVRERNLKTRCFQFDAYRREILLLSDAICRTKDALWLCIFHFFAAIALPAELAQYEVCGGGKNFSKRIALLIG